MRKLLLGLLAVVLVVGVVVSAGVAAASPDHRNGKNRPPAPPVRLGVQVAALTPELAEKVGVEYQKGVVVIQAIPGGPADTAGLKRGDIITAAGGTPVTTPGDLTKVLKEAGDSVTLTVVGKGDVTVVGLSQPLQSPRPGPGSWPRGSGWRNDSPPTPGPMFRPGLRMGGGWPRLLRPEMEGIPAGERFSHFMGGEFRVTDKAGAPHTLKLIPGTVKVVSGDTLTLLTNEGTEVTYTITKDVKGYQFLEKLTVGQKLVVATVDGSVRAIIPSDLPGKPKPHMLKNQKENKA
ncbi:MAG: PDZ domain-containing protein [Chloroflexota bacterium]